MTVACVLKSGGVYDVSWVEKLRRSVTGHFVCLTDVRESEFSKTIEVIPLEHNWPGWWSKIELFRPSLFSGPVLYLDLDNIVTGPVDELIRKTHGFTMAKDFYRGAEGFHNSSVMSWCGHFDIYDLFVNSPRFYMSGYRLTKDKRLGDQAFIEDVFKATNVKINTFEEGRVISYKKDAVNGVPDGALVVQFHGDPKPNEVRGSWVERKWSL